jgi:thiol-disulfide isomerase/thioredoxin
MSKWLFILVGIVVAALIWQARLSSNNGSQLKFTNPLTGSIASQQNITAPGFEKGGEWINSDPLILTELIGPDSQRDDVKAVLVDFWTYSCINCQRTIPYLKSWWDKYQDKGLMIIGVHTPEFEFEKDKQNVISATNKYGVTWPVVQDNDYGIWSDYKNRYWPRKYLINQDGKIVYDHIGEGAYEETEKRIQEILGISDMEVTSQPTSGGIGFGMNQTPELYINQRGQVAGHLGAGPDKVELIGDWKIETDLSIAGPNSSLKLKFRAGEANLVMSTSNDESKSVTVIIDGNTQELDIREDDLYVLFDGDFNDHSLEMKFEEGVRVHAFTFGQ